MSCPHCTHDPWNGDYDCPATDFDCFDCKFGQGRKDPFAKCHQPRTPSNSVRNKPIPPKPS